MVVCGKKTLYPIEYKESYKPDLHFLKIRFTPLSLRKLQASKCTESRLVLTTVETVSFFKGLLKACCHGIFWSLVTLKAKTTQGLTISPRSCVLSLSLCTFIHLSAR